MTILDEKCINTIRFLAADAVSFREVGDFDGEGRHFVRPSSK